MRIFRWVVLIAVIGFLALSVGSSFRGGYFSLPPLKDDQYPISFKSGLRAIVSVEDMRADSVVLPRFMRRLSVLQPDIRFLGVPSDVEFWVKDAWSFCHEPTEQEVAELRSILPESAQKELKRATLAWICFVDVNGEQVFRGMVFTAPRL